MKETSHPLALEMEGMLLWTGIGILIKEDHKQGILRLEAANPVL